MTSIDDCRTLRSESGTTEAISEMQIPIQYPDIENCIRDEYHIINVEPVISHIIYIDNAYPFLTTRQARFSEVNGIIFLDDNINMQNIEIPRSNSTIDINIPNPYKYVNCCCCRCRCYDTNKCLLILKRHLQYNSCRFYSIIAFIILITVIISGAVMNYTIK